VAQARARVPAIHLVVEGAIAIEGTGVTWGPRTLFGALEVMSGRTLAGAAVAQGRTTTLQLASADFAEVLEDNFGLLSSTRRSLARRALAADLGPRPLPPTIERPGSQPLSMVERLMVLRRQLPFASGRIQGLATLAQATEEQRWAPGTVITRAGDAADGAYIVIEGAVRAVRSHGEPRVLGPGVGFGDLETLAEVPLVETVEAITAVRTLHCPADATFDVLEDHTDLALAMVSTLAGALLDAGAMPILGSPPEPDDDRAGMN
jgi:CRP-like cAMP-binding protein